MICDFPRTVLHHTARYRERSVEDDFRLAVQSLWTEERGDDEGEVGTEDGEQLGRTKSHTGSSEDLGDPVKKLTKGSNGNPATQDTEKAPVGSDSSKPAPSPPEHPLQKAINSFDMALGELNQLIHLIDLARAREFMTLERVTPKDDRARKASDLMVSITIDLAGWLLVRLTTDCPSRFRRGA